MIGRIYRSLLSDLFCMIAAAVPAAGVLYDPSMVATVVIDGIYSSGPAANGTVGLDQAHSLIDEMAGLLGVPTGLSQPAGRG